MFIFYLAEAFVGPPSRLPDLYAALFSLYGCVNFVMMYLLGITWQNYIGYGMKVCSEDEILSNKNE
jgi:hypothetical protein